LKLRVIRKFLDLPAQQRQIYAKAFFLLVLVRFGLWILPFRTLQRILEKTFPAPVETNPDAPPSEPFSRAVHAVSGYVPSATCLAQALTLRAQLAREGICSDLAIGVARDDVSGIAAHAWLEVDGKVVIGGGGMERYTRMGGPE